MSAVCIGVSFLVRKKISARQLVVEARQDSCTGMMLQRVQRDEHPKPRNRRDLLASVLATRQGSSFYTRTLI